MCVEHVSPCLHHEICFIHFFLFVMKMSGLLESGFSSGAQAALGLKVFPLPQSVCVRVTAAC